MRSRRRCCSPTASPSCATASMSSPTTRANFDRETIVQAMVGRDSVAMTLYGSDKTTCAPAGERVLTVQNSQDGADGAEQFALGVRRADHRRVRACRRRAAPRRSRSSRASEARLLPRRRDPAARQAGPLSRARACGARRHRLCDRRPQGRRLLRDDVDRATTSISGFSRASGAAAFSVGAGCERSATTGSPALNVRAIGDPREVVELSGGNQQKVVIAKSLVQEPRPHHLR